jgi:hypothetical protein
MCSQYRRNPQEASILKMSLLIMNLSKSIHQWNTRVTSKQLSAERLKLIMKLSQEVIHAMKHKSSLLILAWLTSGRRQLRTKSVNLTPNNRELIEESINSIITLAKKLLLMNISKKSRLSCGLIATVKKSSYLMRPLKLHNISRKMILHTSHKNRTNPSILIKSSPVCTKLRLIWSQMIIIICNKSLLLSSSSLLRVHRLRRSRRRRRAGHLAREKLSKMKSTHVQTYTRNPFTIVGAIEKHWTSQHWDRAWRSRRKTHDDDERARAAAVGDEESEEEKEHKQFFSTLLFFEWQYEATKKIVETSQQ